MKILRLKNSVFEIYSLKIPLVNWPLQINAQSIFFTDRHTHTHMYIHSILLKRNGVKGARLPFCRRLGVLQSQFWPFGEAKNLLPQEIEPYCLRTLAIYFIPSEKCIRFNLWRGPNIYDDRIISCCYRLFFNSPAFLQPSGFFSILFARSEWSDNAADSMAFKLTYQLNLRLVDIQNKRWRTSVFVQFKIVFPLLVAWRFIVLRGKRRVRISLSSK
jgi:hypothetical protein